MYITAKTLPITRWVELVGKKEFISATFDSNNKIFIIHIAFLVSSNLDIDAHFFCQAWITSLKVDQSPTISLFKYVDFADIFSPDFVAKLLEHIRINNHPIDLPHIQ